MYDENNFDDLPDLIDTEAFGVKLEEIQAYLEALEGVTSQNCSEAQKKSWANPTPAMVVALLFLQASGWEATRRKWKENREEAAAVLRGTIGKARAVFQARREADPEKYLAIARKNVSVAFKAFRVAYEKDPERFAAIWRESCKTGYAAICLDREKNPEKYAEVSRANMQICQDKARALKESDPDAYFSIKRGQAKKGRVKCLANWDVKHAARWAAIKPLLPASESELIRRLPSITESRIGSTLWWAIRRGEVILVKIDKKGVGGAVNGYYCYYLRTEEKAA
jgi:hypothetical protein